MRQLIKRAMVRAIPRSAFVTETAGRRVCLTFDDGPHPEHTPQLLDVLAEQRVRATFFVIGEHAERHPDIIRRIADEGHALGSHSYSHTPPETTSAAVLAEETVRTNELLERITGRVPTIVRPPYGTLNITKTLHLWRLRQAIVLWNVDPRDYACRDHDELALWLRDHPLAGGDIVLLHDSHPHAAAVLPSMVETCRRRGLALHHVHQLDRVDT